MVGPATDYSSAMAQWVINRRSQRSIPLGFEFERPSPSYVIDVRVSILSGSPSKVTRQGRDSRVLLVTVKD